MVTEAYVVDKATPYVKFNIFENIDFCSAGFSTRHGGVSKGCYESMNLGFGRGDEEAAVRENFRLIGEAAGFEAGSVCLPNQCHTNCVRVVTENERGSGFVSPKVKEPVDAQITNVPGVTLICYGADCVPVYLCDVKNKAIGLCHAGWKGTILNIVTGAIKRMSEEYGTNPADIKAVIGPSICRDCYEVSADVAEQFIAAYEKYDGLALYDKLAEKTVTDIGNGKYLLSLWKANFINLINAGVGREHISISGLCTKCNHDMFFSHRYHKDARGANAGFMYIRQDKLIH